MPRTTSALALLLALAHNAAAVDADATTCKTMSLNVRTSNAADGGKGSWDARKPHMQHMLEQQSPDFVGTQEASPAQYEFLRGINGYAAIGECAGSCSSNERPFILYKRSVWTVLESGDFALSDNTEQLGSNTWGLEYNRAATWGRFRHQSTGKTVCVFNTHYDMAKGHAKSSVLVADKMAALCKHGDLAMLTGDFNTDLGSEALQYLVGAQASGGKRSPFPLVSALDRVGATDGTFIGNGVFQGALSTTRLDFVFAKAENLCVQVGEVLDERFDGANAISDHAQVVATFCLGDSCTGCVGSDSHVQSETPAPTTPTPIATEPAKVTPQPTKPTPIATEPAKVTLTPIATEPSKLITVQPAPVATEPAKVTPQPTTPTPQTTASATPVVTPAATTSQAFRTVGDGGAATPGPSVPKRPDCFAE